jgi:ATP-dependent DNA ligase
MPRPEIESRVRYVDDVAERGRDLYRLVCRRDCEGIVAKWKRGAYHMDGVTTSWLKIKNPTCSQAEGRHELFGGRVSGTDRLTIPRRLDGVLLSSARL